MAARVGVTGVTWPLGIRRSFRVDPTVQRVVKFLPTAPPRRGEAILVDGVRCEVTRAVVRWREPGVWELRRLRARLAPQRTGEAL